MSDSTKVGDYYLTQSRIIGSGSFSKVYLAESPTGKKAAIKKVKKTIQDRNHQKIARSEAKILKGLHSSGVCQLLGTHEENNHFYLIQSYCEGKTLAKILADRKKLSFKEAEIYFKNILTALEYLIRKGIMHRDLKPENIICRSNTSIVLIDFGFACKIGKHDQPILNQEVGTPIYMSPQILTKAKYNSKSDIWSLGVILFQMIHGYSPFEAKSTKQMIKKIFQNENLFIPQIMVSITIKKLIRKCLTIDPKKRISWSQLFEWKKSGFLPGDTFADREEDNPSCSCSCKLF